MPGKRFKIDAFGKRVDVKKPKKSVKEPTLREKAKSAISGSSGMAAQRARQLDKQRRENEKTRKELLGS